MTQAKAHFLVIDDSLCRLCRRCLVMKACRYMAVIRFDRQEAPVIDVGRCTKCGACLHSCPFEAVQVRGKEGK
ncbi:MAG: 4Fe-4S dicluster domain-containing protein [Chloroflexi bacterium]|nr:4Fe-4S dicluster domain-containing protein [Chloroflexota bacterium]